MSNYSKNNQSSIPIDVLLRGTVKLDLNFFLPVISIY